MSKLITLIPCESGYQVRVDDVLAGHLMCRVWQATGQVTLDHWLVGPANIEAKCKKRATMGEALDYLLSTVRS